MSKNADQYYELQISCSMTKKAQSDQSSLCAQWVAKGPNFLHENSEDSDQNGQLNRVFVWWTVILLVLSCSGS